MVHGQWYYLMSLGFSLNIALHVMKAVIKTIQAQDLKIKCAILPYFDNLLVDEDLVSVEQATVHFSAFRLECKQAACAADGAWLLGLYVQPVNG